MISSYDIENELENRLLKSKQFKICSSLFIYKSLAVAEIICLLPGF